MSLNFIKAWRNDKWYTIRVLIWRFTLVLIKINYGQIGDQTGLFNTINPLFYTIGNRFVGRTGTFGDFFTCPVGQQYYKIYLSDVSFHWYRTIGQTLMSRPDCLYTRWTLYNYWLWNRLLSGLINLKKSNIHRAAGEMNIHF
jgi:hypothetical protein